jgi:hypothetical protein
MRDYILDNSDIIVSLQRTGYAHTCSRCERGMYVKKPSGLCVWCYNALQDEHREPRIVRSVERREAAPAEPAARTLTAAAAH